MYQILITIMTFLTGLAVGSFLNCLIYRLETNQTFLKGRSFCPHCRHTLKWKDLVPLLSFLLLKGRCRYCGKKISWQYPLVELSTGILFVLIFNFLPPQNFGAGFNQFSIFNSLNLIYYWAVSAFLIVIFIYDLKHYIIPDKVIYPAILVSGIWYIVSGIFFNFYTKYEILNTIYAAFGAGLFFLLIILISRGKWMGLGDFKLAILMGLFLGFPNILVALFFSFFLGGIIGTALILAKKKGLNSEVPFGPFLASGTFIALFWGEKIISWYLAFLK